MYKHYTQYSIYSIYTRYIHVFTQLTTSPTKSLAVLKSLTLRPLICPKYNYRLKQIILFILYFSRSFDSITGLNFGALQPNEQPPKTVFNFYVLYFVATTSRYFANRSLHTVPNLDSGQRGPCSSELSRTFFERDNYYKCNTF